MPFYRRVARTSESRAIHHAHPLALADALHHAPAYEQPEQALAPLLDPVRPHDPRDWATDMLCKPDVGGVGAVVPWNYPTRNAYYKGYSSYVMANRVAVPLVPTMSVCVVRGGKGSCEPPRIPPHAPPVRPAQDGGGGGGGGRAQVVSRAGAGELQPERRRRMVFSQVRSRILCVRWQLVRRNLPAVKREAPPRRRLSARTGRRIHCPEVRIAARRLAAATDQAAHPVRLPRTIRAPAQVLAVRVAPATRDPVPAVPPTRARAPAPPATRAPAHRGRAPHTEAVRTAAVAAAGTRVVAADTLVAAGTRVAAAEEAVEVDSRAAGAPAPAAVVVAATRGETRATQRRSWVASRSRFRRSGMVRM